MKQNEDHNQQRKDETAAMTALVNNACSSRDWRARFCAIISHDLNKTREQKHGFQLVIQKTVLGHRMTMADPFLKAFVLEAGRFIENQS